MKLKKQHQPADTPKTGIRFFCPDNLIEIAEDLSDRMGVTQSYVYVMAIERGLKIILEEANQC